MFSRCKLLMFKVIIVLHPLHFCQFSENFLQRVLIECIHFHHSSQITTLPNSPNYVLFKKIKQQQQRKQLQVLLMLPVYFGCVAFAGGCSTTPEAVSLNGIDSPSHCQFPGASQLGVGLHAHLPPPYWDFEFAQVLCILCQML